MTDETKRKLDADRQRYASAAHGVQSGVAIDLERNPEGGRPKHLRVGIDLLKAEQGALARLLIEKGVFSEAEYFKAMADGAEAERDRYAAEISASLGVNVRLG